MKDLKKVDKVMYAQNVFNFLINCLINNNSAIQASPQIKPQ